MQNKELFNACAKQCVWCREQWPIAAAYEQTLHVGPYTKDKGLFSVPCKAASIREAFEYVGYKGIREKRWNPPTVAKMRRAKYPFKVVENPFSRSFWRNLTANSIEVAAWPRWKRSIDHGEKAQRDTPEKLKEQRQELIHWDALEFWARKGCTEGFRYSPRMVGGRINEPGCNWGIGCTVCWGRHETLENKLSENSCY